MVRADLDGTANVLRIADPRGPARGRTRRRGGPPTRPGTAAPRPAARHGAAGRASAVCDAAAAGEHGRTLGYRPAYAGRSRPAFVALPVVAFRSG